MLEDTLKKIIFQRIIDNPISFSEVDKSIQNNDELPVDLKDQFNHYKKQTIHEKLKTEQANQFTREHDFSHTDLSNLDFKNWNMRKYNIQHCNLRGCDLTSTSLNEDSLFGCTLDEKAFETLLPTLRLLINIISLDGVNIVGPLKKNNFLAIKTHLLNLHHGCGFDASALETLSLEDIKTHCSDYIRVIDDWSSETHQQLFLKLFSNKNKIECVNIDASLLRTLMPLIYNTQYTQLTLTGNYSDYIDPQTKQFKIESKSRVYSNFGNNEHSRNLRMGEKTALSLMSLLQNPKQHGINNIDLNGIIDHLDFSSVDWKSVVPSHESMLTKRAFLTAIENIKKDGLIFSPMRLTGDLSGIDFLEIPANKNLIFCFKDARMDAKTFQTFIPHQLTRQNRYINTRLVKSPEFFIYGDCNNLSFDDRLDLKSLTFEKNNSIPKRKRINCI